MIDDAKTMLIVSLSCTTAAWALAWFLPGPWELLGFAPILVIIGVFLRIRRRWKREARASEPLDITPPGPWDHIYVDPRRAKRQEP